MRKSVASLSILLVIALFYFLSVGLASADSYTYTLSGGSLSRIPLVVDDDLEVKVNGKTVFIDDDGVSTHDGRATWKGAPITFSASPGEVLQIIATNPGGVDIELSELYLHVNGQSLKLSDGVPKAQSEEYKFFDESFTISIPTPKVSIPDYSPSPVHGEEDLTVKVSWSNIPNDWKLTVSLEESEVNITRLANDVSKMVSGSGEETFKLKVYPTTETHSEAKVCACLYNEKGELKILDKKPIKVPPPLLINITSYSPSPVHEGEDLNVNVSWSNIPTGWKLIVSLEESDSNYTRLADDVNISKMVSDSGEETFKLKVYPTIETHSEAKVCACFYNEKGELKILDKKGIIVHPKMPLLIPQKYLYILPIILIPLILLPYIAYRKSKKRLKAMLSPKDYKRLQEIENLLGKGLGGKLGEKLEKEASKLRANRKPPDKPEQKTTIKKEPPQPISEPITIERAIYDPCKQDFIEGRLPRIKEWINRYDPGAYWFAVSIQNDTNETIEEWSVELETSAALKVKDAKIEGIEIEIPHEAHLGLFKISVPKEYGIVIPKGGAQRVYFKLRAEKPKTMYEISGVFKSEITGNVPIRAKEFKYLCDTGVSPEAVKAELKKTFSEKDAARLANTFRVVQEIRSSYCNNDTKAREINKEFDLLKMYLTEKEFLDEIGGIQRRINAELREDERLDDKHIEEVKDFCEKFTEMWIARFLR